MKRGVIMPGKPTYEELEKRVKELEKEVADLKGFEGSLWESEERYRNLLNTVNDLVFTVDTEGNILFANPLSRKFTGYGPEETTGHKFTEYVHPDDVPELLAGIQQVLNAEPKEGIRGIDLDAEYRMVRRDGEVIWVAARSRPITDAQGRTVGFSGVARDITERKQADEALRESEEKYRDLADSIADIFFALNGDLKYTYWNKASEELTGISAKDAIERQILDIFPDNEETRRAVDVYQGVLRSRQPKAFVNEYHLGGRRYFFEINAYPSTDGVSVFVKDITEHKQAEDALRESEEKLRLFMESATDVFCLYDPELNLVQVNEVGLKMLPPGTKREDIIGKNITELIPNVKETGRYDKYLEVIKTGRPFSIDDFVPHPRFGDIHLAVRAFKVGTGLGMIAANITERKQVEEALRQSEERYRGVVEGSIQGIVIARARDSIIQFANQAAVKMFGYAGPDELVSKNLWETLVEPEEWPELQGRTATLLSGKSIPIHPGWKGIRKDGTRVWIQTTASLISWQGEPAVLGFYAEITELKQAEEEKERLQAQLFQAQKAEAIGTLAGGIAHNFNNLLMGVMGNTSLMLLETDPGHPNYERVKNIEKSIQRGSKLTRQLLGYAREGGYEIRPISLNQLIKETSDTFATTKKEIRVDQELAKDLFGINADRGQIEQILLNLYVNASDAMPGGGDLFLKTMNVTHKDMSDTPYKAKPGNYVLLTVRDTGAGMDKETEEKIFDPFFTTKGLAKGTGLGLASVYGIVKAHGGYIDVESKKGHGTTFRIYLPASSN